MKYVIHRPLVGCSGILEAEGYYNPLEQANVTRTSESSLEYIFLRHENLVLPSVAIKEAHHLVACCCIHEQVG